MIIITLSRAGVPMGTQGWIGSRLQTGGVLQWPGVPCTGMNLGRMGVSIGGLAVELDLGL